MASDFYIKKIEVNGSKTKVLTQKLVDNGNANEFDTLLQTGDGAVTQLVANTNDYSPTNWAMAKHFVLDASTPINITGAVYGSDWEEVYFWNKSANAITLTHDDALSADSNRFYCQGGASVVLNQHDGCYMVYDQSAAKWRVKNK